ncbi:hypothetical protein CEP54_008936 [Fusarium duplospermum]|uniref:Uncharacterized protein n=1 Tax=Fusarium duplospermum TaxID=1325734 RepID=A0A428PT29_9HYPO|nr:hypothetical protein CEP54_008936 [Fusarium duplospermum]
MASAPTQILLRRLLKSGGPSTVHGRLAMRLEPPSVNDRIEEMNTQLRALEVQLGHKGQDPKAAVQDLEHHKMYRDLRDIARGVLGCSFQATVTQNLMYRQRATYGDNLAIEPHQIDTSLIGLDVCYKTLPGSRVAGGARYLGQLLSRYAYQRFSDVNHVIDHWKKSNLLFSGLDCGRSERREAPQLPTETQPRATESE